MFVGVLGRYGACELLDADERWKPVSVIDTRVFDNGLILLVEPKKNVKSCSVQWVFPAGSCSDPSESQGASVMLADMLPRGAGDLDSRALSDSMDRCGMRRSADVGIHHLVQSTTMLGSELQDGMSLVTSMVLEPRLPADAIEPVRSLCLQALDSLQDEPQQESMLRLRARHRQPPFNRSGYGEREALESIQLEDLQAAWRERIVPGGSILSVAGDVDMAALCGWLEDRMQGWEGAFPEPPMGGERLGGFEHVDRDTSQVHIAMAWDGPAAADPNSVFERIATRVFGGASSGRLFTEVRQKRSLCYSVNGVYRAGRDVGVIGVYSGTTPDRAQETLDTCLAEFDRMSEGITHDEFRRIKTGLESSLVLSGESSSARAAALVTDQFRLGRARSLDEARREIAAVTLEDVNEYLATRSVGSPTIVTMGPVALEPG